MNTDENCDTCGGPCVYRDGHAEPAPDERRRNGHGVLGGA